MYNAFDPKLLAELIEDFEGRNPYAQIPTKVHVFPQWWGSSALGYADGVSMQAFWQAHTIVLYSEERDLAEVYFGTKRLAYTINSPTNTFWDDVKEKRLKSCIEDHKAYIKIGAR